MTNNLETAIYQAATATFEEIAFMLPTEELEDEQRNAAVTATASVTFHGEIDGTLMIAVCGSSLLPQLAANMLGDDEEHSEQTQRDALGEIANIICGNALPLITNRKAVFHLDAPDIETAADASTSGAFSLPPTAKVQMGLDEGRADLMLFLKS